MIIRSGRNQIYHKALWDFLDFTTPQPKLSPLKIRVKRYWRFCQIVHYVLVYANCNNNFTFHLKVNRIPAWSLKRFAEKKLFKNTIIKSRMHQ